MATRGDSLRSSADSPAVQPLYMGRDAGAASFRDWKRAVDMKLSKHDDDLLYLGNHGERSDDDARRLTQIECRHTVSPCSLHGP